MATTRRDQSAVDRRSARRARRAVTRLPTIRPPAIDGQCVGRSWSRGLDVDGPANVTRRTLATPPAWPCCRRSTIRARRRRLILASRKSRPSIEEKPGRTFARPGRDSPRFEQITPGAGVATENDAPASPLLHDRRATRVGTPWKMPAVRNALRRATIARRGVVCRISSAARGGVDGRGVLPTVVARPRRPVLVASRRRMRGGRGAGDQLRASRQRRDVTQAAGDRRSVRGDAVV